MDTRKSELNPELFDMMKQGKLSAGKILNLIALKELVDRFAVTPFIEKDKLEQIKEKTGVEPDILTWGDYFQTESHPDISKSRNSNSKNLGNDSIRSYFRTFNFFRKTRILSRFH